MRRIFIAGLAVLVCSCGADNQRALQTEASTTTTAIAEVATTTTTLVQTPTATLWSAPAPVPEREPNVLPAHRRIDDRNEFLLRFGDGSGLILSLTEPWGDPTELEARPYVNVTPPSGTKYSAPIMDPPTMLVVMCGQSCVELDQEARPDGGRNRRFQQQTLNRAPSEFVIIEFANWAMRVPSYEFARAFTLETVDGFPVAHQQTDAVRVGPAEMFLCIRSCAARMIVERMGTEACAARLKTEPNNETVSNSCIDEWHLYLDATFDRVNEARAALTLRPAD